jgi:hypothetical protein
MPQLGGQRAYRGCLDKDRSTREKQPFHWELDIGFDARSGRPGRASTAATDGRGSLLRHPCFAQAVVRPFAHLDEAWIPAQDRRGQVADCLAILDWIKADAHGRLPCLLARR